MDKKNKKYFVETLKKMKSEKEKILEDYEKKINSSSDNNSESSAYPFHSADIGTDAAMLEKATINLNELLNEIRMIDEAFNKINDGTYGICEMCGGDIPLKRLKAVPYAKLCINCKEKTY